MFVELHTLQSFVPSNLNRDDTGSPKDCIFGGYRRARISSQSYKAALRRDFHENTMPTTPLGQRTKIMAEHLAAQLAKAGKDANKAMEAGLLIANGYAGKMDRKNKEKTSVLVYLSDEELSLMRDALLTKWDALEAAQESKDKTQIVSDIVKELVRRTEKRTSAPDIALFGRMLADNATTNIDAACQVAHAISTHRVAMKMDYYTAIDHLKPDDQTGAEMVGFTNFNSACYYRYVRIDCDKLAENLRDEPLALETIEAFLRSTFTAVPTGKQTAFAAQNPTNLAMAVVRGDGKSWNLANAFETPIVADTDANEGYINPSIRELDAYWANLNAFYDDAEIPAVAVHVMHKHQTALSSLSDHVKASLSEWVQAVLDAVQFA